MKLTIDNYDGQGPRDYTDAVDSVRTPQVTRKLNQSSELRFSLVINEADFVIPKTGARVTLGRLNGSDVFTGYVSGPPTHEYLGWNEKGAFYRYNFVAESDEWLLNRKVVPDRPPFVDRSAGDALQELTKEMLPGVLSTATTEKVDTIAYLACNPQKNWSYHAAELALQSRGAYRTLDAELILGPVGETTHVLDESSTTFSREGLTLYRTDGVVNDVTVIGRMETSDYVKDYFLGDGFTLKFYLSQQPFTRSTRTLIEDEYLTLDGTKWAVSDPGKAVAVAGGELKIAGGTGIDGETTVEFVEEVELGGAVILQHGDVAFDDASNGIIGGLYPSDISVPGCVAGFRILPVSGQSQIQALIHGALTGTAILTKSGHHYVFTTRVYSAEVYRTEQRFHSSIHTAGNGLGGATVVADARVVLEVHDIDPSSPGTQVAPSTILFDGVLTGAPGFARYALINANELYCRVTFTRILSGVDAVVRSALPDAAFRTRLVGSLTDGADCHISTDPAVQFYPQTVPAENEQMVVSYRGSGRALARVVDESSISAMKRGNDDGVRGVVRNVKYPVPRSSGDCEKAAIALLDDSAATAWGGTYECWSAFLPGGNADIFPGDGLQVEVPSQGASFTAIVRRVEIKMTHPGCDVSRYKIEFADDATESLAFEFQDGEVSQGLDIDGVDVTEVGTTTLPALKDAQMTDITSTSVDIDAGGTAPAGGGFEVRSSDYGWGPDNDRNLVGRFASRNFTVARLARVQTYFLRQYDASTPVKYSRYTAVLHVDYPL